MAGRRLLDAAILANATRAVARQHLKIRSTQFDTWNKTSVVAKAVKDQTDRITLTLQAANALAQRFNEPDPSPRYKYAQSDDEAIPRQETVNSETRGGFATEGMNQDHHYERSEDNTTFDPAENGELDIKQEKPPRYPMPDGSIPPHDVPVQSASPMHIDPDTTTTRAKQAPIKEPLAQDQQPGDTNLTPNASERSSIPEPDIKQTSQIPNKDAVPEQQEPPEGINTDVFHSPRISELLGGKSKPAKAKGAMDMRAAKNAHVDGSKLAGEKDQDIFNVRESRSSAPVGSDKPATDESSTTFTQASSDDVHDLAADIAKDAANPEAATDDPQTSAAPYHMRESRVPSSRFGRLAQYGGLATSMVFGAVGETFRRATGSGDSSGSLMLSAGNMERLVAKLSRMRGAALKLGQMMSFQDSKMLPAPIHEVLLRVQDNADYMPPSQRDRVLSSNLGADWRSLFSSFTDVPIAAASIGQVHQATLASSNAQVAVKIQYPGVATSISSDLSNLSILLTASRLLPKGLYLDKTIANAREELAWECDYKREAECQERFRTLLADEIDTFTVPAVIHEASGPQVLTAEMMHGTAVTKPSLQLKQSERDWIGTQILRLCLRELTEFHFMQTDPNWTNFLYNRASGKLELLDFGATRAYPAHFVDPYVGILIAAATNDRSTIRDLSVQLGYLTGSESRAMEDAHIASILTLAEPFRAARDPDAPYDFRDQTITDRVREQIPVMLRERLAPPPEETYSLHRKLSGAFLLLARLGSRVKCRQLFVDAVDGWRARRDAAAATTNP